MTWTATLKDCRREPLAWSVTIVYTSDTEKPVVRTYNPQSVQGDVIPALARAEIARFEQLAASDGKVPFAVGAVLDLTPPAVTPRSPTSAELARAAWISDYRKLQAMKKALAVGIGRQADVDTQAAKVRAAYLPEYEELL